MKTMSDFIMEQEVFDTTVGSDVEIMESFMKVQAVGAVAECYCEHAAISAFATEAGLNVFSESDDSIGKKVLNGIKDFFSNLWEWLKALVKGVINIFTKSSLEKCIAELKAAQRDGKTTITDLDERFLDAEKVLDLVEDFGEAVKAGAEGGLDKGKDSAKKFQERAEKWLKGFKEHNKADDWKGASADGYDYQADGEKKAKTHDQITTLIDTLERMQKANIPSSGRKLLKKFDFDKNNYKTKDGKTDKELIKDIKKAANLLAKAYDKYADSTVKMVRKLLKKDIKADELKALQQKNSDLADADKAGKVAESYSENSDGYFFL